MKSDYMAKIKTGAMANVGFLKEVVKVYFTDVLFFLKDFGFHYAVTWAFFFPPPLFSPPADTFWLH